MKDITHKTKYMIDIETRENLRIEEVLRRKFVDENKSTKLIASELNVSYKTAFKLLKLAGIYSRKLNI